MRDIELGQRIRRFRADKNWSLADLAKAVGSDHGTISRYENAKITPGSEKLKAIAKALGVTPDMILTGVSDTNLDDAPVFGLEPQTMITLLRSLEQMKPVEREKVMRRIIQVESKEIPVD